MSTWTVLFHAGARTFLSDYDSFNGAVDELERRGRDDLMRQGIEPGDIRFRLELDMRYGNQRVETPVVSEVRRIGSLRDVLSLIEQFYRRYGERFGEGSQSPEAGVRINTIRVCAFVEQPTVQFALLAPPPGGKSPGTRAGVRDCHFVGHPAPIPTPVFRAAAVPEGTVIEGPAIVASRATTYLVEPGWTLRSAAQGAVWFIRNGGGGGRQ
jgi:N-methylhydantoinase A